MKSLGQFRCPLGAVDYMRPYDTFDVYNFTPFFGDVFDGMPRSHDLGHATLLDLFFDRFGDIDYMRPRARFEVYSFTAFFRGVSKTSNLESLGQRPVPGP